VGNDCEIKVYRPGGIKNTVVAYQRDSAQSYTVRRGASRNKKRSKGSGDSGPAACAKIFPGRSTGEGDEGEGISPHL